MRALDRWKLKNGDGKPSDERTAAALGATTTGGLAATWAAKHELADMRENATVRRTKAFADFQDKLRPGDILFHHRSANKSPGVASINDIPIPGTEADYMMGAKGDHHYHASVYQGRGKISEASDFEKGVRRNAPLYGNVAENIRAYRPQSGVVDAMSYAAKSHKTPYIEQEGLVKGALEHLFNPLDGLKKSGPSVPCEGSFCTQHVANSYPRLFDKVNMSPADMRHSKGLELIARYEPKAKRSMREIALTRGAYPIARNLKHGLAVAGLSLGAMKLAEYLQRKEFEKDG